MIYALGGISGAHFNPAITIAVWLSWRQKIKFHEGILYILVQICAAMCAAALYGAVIVDGGVTSPPASITLPGKKCTWYPPLSGSQVFSW